MTGGAGGDRPFRKVLAAIIVVTAMTVGATAAVLAQRQGELERDARATADAAAGMGAESAGRMLELAISDRHLTRAQVFDRADPPAYSAWADRELAAIAALCLSHPHVLSVTIVDSVGHVAALATATDQSSGASSMITVPIAVAAEPWGRIEVRVQVPRTGAGIASGVAVAVVLAVVTAVSVWRAAHAGAHPWRLALRTVWRLVGTGEPRGTPSEAVHDIEQAVKDRERLTALSAATMRTIATDVQMAADVMSAAADRSSRSRVEEIDHHFPVLLRQCAEEAERVKAKVQAATGKSGLNARIRTAAGSVAAEMTGQLSLLQEAARSMSRSIADGLRETEAGVASSQQTAVGIKRCAEAAAEAAAHVYSLRSHSQDIGDAVSLISDIAGQTNMLALNAAIEAARAGEHGRGLGVVAQQVRRLADSSARETRRIKDLVDGLRSASSLTEAAMERAMQVADVAMHAAETTARPAAAAKDQTLAVQAELEHVTAGLQAIDDIRIHTEELEMLAKEDAFFEVAAAADRLVACLEELTARSWTAPTTPDRETGELPAVVDRLHSLSADLIQVAEDLDLAG